MFITPKIYKHSTSSAVLLEDHKTEEYRDKGACISLVDLKASSTLEAALVLPIFIYAVMAVMYFIQIMAVRSHINDALYMTLKKCAGYAYIYENYAEYAGEKEELPTAELLIVQVELLKMEWLWKPCAEYL